MLSEMNQSRVSILGSPKSRNPLNELFRASLQEKTGSSVDIFAQNRMNTIAYQPVNVGGDCFLNLFISVPT